MSRVKRSRHFFCSTCLEALLIVDHAVRPKHSIKAAICLASACLLDSIWILSKILLMAAAASRDFFPYITSFCFCPACQQQRLTAFKLDIELHKN